MTDWTQVVGWVTTAGVSHVIEQRYDHSDDVYEVRHNVLAGDMTYVQNKWRTESKVNTLE